MAKKHIKRHSTSLAIMEMHKNTSTTIHVSEMAKNSQNLSFQVLVRMWKKGSLIHISETEKQYGHFGKQCVSYFKHTLTIQLSNPTSRGKLTKFTKICMLIFTQALFTNTKTWRQPNRPWRGEWLHKLVYPYWNIIQLYKGTNCWYRQPHRQTSNASC